MNKFLSASLLLSGISAQAGASTIDDAFKNASTSGQIRFGYISNAPDVTGSTTTTGAVIGGEIKFETTKWKGLQLVLAPYFAEKVDALSGEGTNVNGDFFNSANEGFAYLGEANLGYSFAQGTIRIGRQKLDTPFINTDDIRLFSNTFNAAWFEMKLGTSLTLDAGLVTSWAGFDSGSSQEEFKNASNDGVTALGLNYKSSNSLSGQAWYYNFDEKYSLFYADVSYNSGALELGIQAANYSEKSNSGTEGTVLGALVSYSTGPFKLSAVINSASNATGKSADLGLGGGNFYAAMDEMTIAGLNDAQARVLSVEYAATENFTASLSLGHFEDSSKATNTDEIDLVIDYNASDKLNLSVVHTMLDNKGSPFDATTNFTRQMARVTYAF